MKYLTVRQVSEITGYSEWTVRDLARRHALDVRLRRRRPRGLKGSQPTGGSWRFRESDVHQFMNN